MGSKYSQRNNEEVKIEPQYWGNDLYKNSIKYDNYEWDNYSTSQQTQENSELIQNKKTIENNNINENEQLYPFKFEWKGLGSSVIITGSFLENWTKFPMIKNNETEIFELTLKLPKKKHYFKFIVDNKWVCSNQYPTTLDKSNNQNNFIDLTNYIPPKNLMKIEEYKNGEFKPHRSKVIVMDKKDKHNYNCKYPLIHELNPFPPNIFVHYDSCFNIDYQSNQNNISKQYLKYENKNFVTENNTYKKILVVPHEKLMHFCQNINDLKNKNKQYIRGSSTNRNKHKYLTVVYYKPKSSK